MKNVFKYCMVPGAKCHEKADFRGEGGRRSNFNSTLMLPLYVSLTQCRYRYLYPLLEMSSLKSRCFTFKLHKKQQSHNASHLNHQITILPRQHLICLEILKISGFLISDCSNLVIDITLIVIYFVRKILPYLFCTIKLELCRRFLTQPININLRLYIIWGRGVS